jgi:uncharacterized protein (TIGR02453 family)
MQVVVLSGKILRRRIRPMAKSKTTTTTNAKRGASAKKAAAAPAKKQTAKKATAKKATAEKKAAKKASAKKAPAEKKAAAEKKAPAKKAPAKKAPAKKASKQVAAPTPAPTKKSATKKSPAKKSAAKTDVAAPMPAAKKSPAKKSAAKTDGSKTAVAPPSPAPTGAGSKPAKRFTKKAISMTATVAPTPAPAPSAAGSKPPKKRAAAKPEPESTDDDDDDGQTPAAARPGGAESVSASATFRGFGPGLFEFFAELAQNNDRGWFEAHKRRYESEVREPALAFVRAMGSRLAELSEHFIASTQKVGGSLMRIHRDTRFSPDKTPYKTNLGVQFRHAAGKDVHAPGLYVHVDNEGVFLGSGTWHPEPEPLAAIRKAIAEQPDAWQQVRDDEGFRKHWALEGDSLTRPPRGFDKQHPCVDDLRRKDHIAVCRLSADEIMRPDMVDRITTRFVASSPYLRFLCRAIGVSF